jgi:hypothetical protein
MWRQWQAYLNGESERPFELAEDIRARWQAHFAWEAYRKALEDGNTEAQRPQPAPEDGPAARAAHAAKARASRPTFTTWVETIGRPGRTSYDMSMRILTRMIVSLYSPIGITARLWKEQEISSILSIYIRSRKGG